MKFYYPQDLVQQANGVFRAKAARRKQDQQTTIARLPRLAPDALNFNYRIDGDDVPWKPVRVFDDGTHVYIQMPQAMRVTEAPALLVPTRTGDCRAGELPSPAAVLRRGPAGRLPGLGRSRGVGRGRHCETQNAGQQDKGRGPDGT